MSRDAGVDADKLAELHDWRTSSRFSERERLALELADGMSQTPAVVPEELFGRLRAAFDPAQLVELASAVAWENYRARFNTAFGCESEEFSEGAVCALPARPGEPMLAG